MGVKVMMLVLVIFIAGMAYYMGYEAGKDACVKDMIQTGLNLGANLLDMLK